MPSKAAALKYDKDKTNAPKVVAQGKGELAEQIILKAKEFNVPLFANEALVDSLINLDLDQEIPNELYQSVVEVFLWLMKNENRLKN
jgi:flagellar biosynthesis protein